jgi:N-acetylneuraminic acid mutarotase
MTVMPMSTPRRAVAATTANCPGSDRICVYAIGGYSATGIVLSSAEVYDVDADTWMSIAPMPTARYGLAAVPLGGLIYAIGGFDDVTYFNTVEVYNPADDTWCAAPSMRDARRGVAAVAGPDGRIYAIGGTTGPTILDSVETYRPGDTEWTTLDDHLSGVRSVAAAAAGPDGRIYAIGGNSGDAILDTVEAYCVDTARCAGQGWQLVCSMSTPRGAPAAAVGLDGLIYAIGGRSSPTDYLNSVEAYDPATGWTLVAAMSTRRYSLAAATGPDGRIYAMGGFDGSSFLNVVEAYQP